MEQWNGSALTILPRYLAMVLAGRKTWELRKFRSLATGQRIPLVASGTCKIWGSARLTAVEWKTRAQLEDAETMHQIPPGALEPHVQDQGGCFAWILTDPQTLTKPLPLNRSTGSVNWVKLPPDLQNQVQQSADRKLAEADLLTEMQAAKADRTAQTKAKAKAKGRAKTVQKRKPQRPPARNQRTATGNA